MNLKLIKNLMRLEQNKLQKVLIQYLKNKGYSKIDATDMYIIAEGALSICLCAHVDTVFPILPQEFYYDYKKKTLWSPDGMGADDRAGIYAIIQLIEAGFRPHIIFTNLEEIGGVGADALIKAYPICPFLCKAIIQLDRHGKQDAVFYQCDNKKFKKIICSYSFKENYGTFTDISIIAPAWKIAAVNLSIGYYNEHSEIELLKCNELEWTIKKVTKILEDCNKWNFYEYIPAPKVPIWWQNDHCICCGKPLKVEDQIILGDEKCFDRTIVCEDCYNTYIV